MSRKTTKAVAVQAQQNELAGPHPWREARNSTGQRQQEAIGIMTSLPQLPSLADLPSLATLGTAKNALRPLVEPQDDGGDTGLYAMAQDVNQTLANRQPPTQAQIDRRSVPRLDPEDPETYAKLTPTVQRVAESSSNWSNFLGGLGKVLDIVDIPRMAIAKLLNLAVGAKASSPEPSVLGGDRIYGADTMRKLGVESTAGQMIGGFVLDVLTDPLTYATGIGGIIRAAGKASIGGVGKALLKPIAMEAMKTAEQKGAGHALAYLAEKGGMALHDSEAVANALKTTEATNALTAAGKAADLAEALKPIEPLAGEAKTAFQMRKYARDAQVGDLLNVLDQTPETRPLVGSIFEDVAKRGNLERRGLRLSTEPLRNFPGLKKVTKYLPDVSTGDLVQPGALAATPRAAGALYGGIAGAELGNLDDNAGAGAVGGAILGGILGPRVLPKLGPALKPVGAALREMFGHGTAGPLSELEQKWRNIARAAEYSTWQEMPKQVQADLADFQKAFEAHIGRKVTPEQVQQLATAGVELEQKSPQEAAAVMARILGDYQGQGPLLAEKATGELSNKIMQGLGKVEYQAPELATGEATHMVIPAGDRWIVVKGGLDNEGKAIKPMRQAVTRSQQEAMNYVASVEGKPIIMEADEAGRLQSPLAKQGRPPEPPPAGSTAGLGPDVPPQPSPAAGNRNQNIAQQIAEQIHAANPNITRDETAAFLRILRARAQSAGVSTEEYIRSHIAGFLPAEGRIPATDKLGQLHKGAVQVMEDGRRLVYLMQNADASTLVHEAAHIFLGDLAPESLAVVEKWAGVEAGQWTRQNHEQFAGAFERYLRDGVAPTRPLRPVFEKFKEWLTRIYSSLAGTPLEAQVPPELKKIFDGLLTRKPQLRADFVGAASAPADMAAARSLAGKVATVPVSQIAVDANRFQFKLGTDQAGASGLLKSVKKFDPELGGVIGVWVDPADGKTYVINGHHRLDLAKRSGVESVNVMFLDAANAAEARAKGALINIAEGRGTAIDAAKFVRDSGLTADQLSTRGISMTEGKVKTALALSNLNDSLFHQTVTGILPESLAATIGRELPDHAMQDGLYKLLMGKDGIRTELSNDAVSELIQFVRGSGKTTLEQMNLFGKDVIAQSHAVEKARLSAWIRQQLAKDARIFGFVANKDRAEALTRGNNVIDVQRSKQIAESGVQAEWLYDKVKTQVGPVGKMLEDAAGAVAGGQAERTIRSGLLEQVRKALAEIDPATAMDATQSNNPLFQTASTGQMRLGAWMTAEESRIAQRSIPKDIRDNRYNFAIVEALTEMGRHPDRLAGEVKPELLQEANRLVAAKGGPTTPQQLLFALVKDHPDDWPSFIQGRPSDDINRAFDRAAHGGYLFEGGAAPEAAAGSLFGATGTTVSTTKTGGNMPAPNLPGMAEAKGLLFQTDKAKLGFTPPPDAWEWQSFDLGNVLHPDIANYVRNRGAKSASDVLALRAAGVPQTALEAEGLSYAARTLAEQNDSLLSAVKRAFAGKKEGFQKQRSAFVDQSMHEGNEMMAADGKKPLYSEDPRAYELRRQLAQERVLGQAGFLTELRDTHGQRILVDKGGKQLIPEGRQVITGMKSPQMKILEGYSFTPSAAEYLTKVDKQWQRTKPWLEVYDRVTSGLKGLMLIAPAYHVRNMASNMWQSASGNGYSLSGMTQGMKVMRAQRGGNVEALARAVEGIGANPATGRAWTRGELAAALEESGLTGRTFFGTEAGPEFAEHLKEVLNGPPSNIERVKRAMNPLEWSRLNRQVGSFLEDGSKIGHVITRMRAGDTLQQATASARRYLFDYGDLTVFEQKTMKRLFPFYSWSRHNFGLQMQLLLERPEFQAIMPKIKGNVEGSLPDGEVVPDALRPDYIRKEAGVQVAGGLKPSYMNLATLAPLGELSMLTPGGVGRKAMDLLSPLIKTPIELASNYDFFRGKPIRSYPGQTEKFAGIDMPPEASKLAGMVRPLSEVNRIVGGAQRNESPVTVAGRATGLRVFEGNLPREIASYERRQAETRGTMRAKAKIAVANGDMNGAVQIAGLMEQNGFPEESVKTRILIADAQKDFATAQRLSLALADMQRRKKATEVPLSQVQQLAKAM